MGQSIEAFMHGTGYSCADCSEEMTFTDTVVSLQIVLPYKTEQGELTFRPFVSPQGAYVYDPYMFHEHCMEDNLETLAHFLEEKEAHKVQDPWGVCKCDACESDIRQGEPTAILEAGELLRSDRSPNGVISVHFEAYLREKTILCLDCVRTLNDRVIIMWDHISYAGECDCCTADRNWRAGIPCFHEQEQYEDE